LSAKLESLGVADPNFESSLFNVIARKLLSGEIGLKHSGRKLYDLAWVYSVYSALELSGIEPLDKMREILRSLLSNEFEFYNVLYDSQASVGLLFSLYHLLDRGNENNDFRDLAKRVLKELEQLQWHENDGEVLAFSYLLSTKLDRGFERKVKSIIDKLINVWINEGSYYALQNLAYVAFSYSYARKGKELFSLVNKMGLTGKSSLMLRRILDISDPELLALILYTLSTLAYEDMISGEIEESPDSGEGEKLIKYLRLEIIPELGRHLNVVIEGLNLRDNPQSVPPNLIAKIRLAKIQSGLDKPFVLSRYEWRVYKQIRVWLLEGYLKVKQGHLLITFLVDALLPLGIIHVLYPFYARISEVITQTSTPGPHVSIFPWITFILLVLTPIDFLIGLNIEILREGEITKNVLLRAFTALWRELYNAIRRGIA
jgi:hypothetical protein